MVKPNYRKFFSNLSLSSLQMMIIQFEITNKQTNKQEDIINIIGNEKKNRNQIESLMSNVIFVLFFLCRQMMMVIFFRILHRTEPNRKKLEIWIDFFSK